MDWVNHMLKINNKFKFDLFGKNYLNLQKCYNCIPKYDPEQTGLMDPHTFNLFLNAFGVFLTKQQLRKIQDAYNKGDGINYIEFIQNVRRDITPKRAATIDHCFDQLSYNGVVQIQKLLKCFSPENHPHVRCKIKTSEQIYHEFEEAILKRSADGKHLNQLQFKEYFYDVNACIPLQREEYFVDVLINGFKMLDNRVTIDRLRQMEVTIYQKVRQKTYFKLDQGKRSKSDFKHFDLQDKGVVDFQRFMQTLQKIGCKFTNRQMRALFAKHAASNGILTYEQMCALLFEMGSGVKDNSNPVYDRSQHSGNFSTTHGMTKRLN